MEKAYIGSHEIEGCAIRRWVVLQEVSCNCSVIDVGIVGARTVSKSYLQSAGCDSRS